MSIAQKEDRILIIGAGIFGASTAYHLLLRGFTNVTIIDRGETLPPPDAASSDLNKIVRTSYSDPFYTRLARDAIAAFKNQEEWPNIYHESGALVCGEEDTLYGALAYQNDLAIGARLEDVPSVAAHQSTLFPPGVELGERLKRAKGYFNKDGGWARAHAGVVCMLEKVQRLGGTLVPAKTVTQLLYGSRAKKADGRISGVLCADGTVVNADLVIVATGAWTPSAFPELDLSRLFVATGQSIATVQLTPEETDLYRACPVVLDLHKAHYVFPPNEDGLVKVARHDSGYTHFPKDLTASNQVSTPRTALSHGAHGLRIPKEAHDLLRQALRDVYPALANRPFSSTRLCWYTDTPDTDWIIGALPAHPKVILATGGSGHAYKFLPIIGRLVAGTIDGTLDSALAAKFSPAREFTTVDPHRGGAQPRVFPEDALCTEEYLQVL